MPGKWLSRLLFRPLLSETLPYEVPIVFSNVQFYRTQCETIVSEPLKKALKSALRSSRSWTIPYEYEITRGTKSVRSLAVVHPLHQLNMATFYGSYERTIVNTCGRSSFTLRSPISVSSAYLEAAGAGRVEARTGDVQSERAPETLHELLDVPLIGSYFAYSKYNNIGRFIESPEFIRLEKRFSRLLKVDISRCFGNIYSHSISWAVKGKLLSKAHARKHSFENVFDRMMMNANSNETNGIVVGPEISRIFAEVIFQDIDERLLHDLRVKGLREEWDFAIRRYVDDYSIFVTDIQFGDYIVERLNKHLAHYKMYANEEKFEVLTRPFVSKISVARKEIKEEFKKIGKEITRIGPDTDHDEARQIARRIRADIDELRIIVARNGVDMSAVSGWLLGFIKTSLRRVATRFENSPLPGCQVGLAEIVAALVRLTFYICALDFRVRPTYSLAEVLILAKRISALLEESCKDQIDHVMAEEFLVLIKTFSSNGSPLSRRRDAVELQNLLVSAAHFMDVEFMRNVDVSAAVKAIVDYGDVSYFQFISAKFCMLKDQNHYESDLQSLNAFVYDRVWERALDVYLHSELYLLFSDFLSSPDVSVDVKRMLFNKVTGGTASKKVMAELGPRMQFADWTGRSFAPLLERKELRPAYE